MKCQTISEESIRIIVNTTMENSSGAITSEWAEVNKLLVEKQTKYIEQTAAINAYKKSIEKISLEKQILMEKIDKEKLLDTYYKEKINSDINKNDLLQQNRKAMKLNIARIEKETQEMENYISAEKAKHAETIKDKEERVAALRDMRFSMEPEYSEYCVAREEYEKALADNKALKDQLHAKKKFNKELHEKNLDERNKQIVDFVQRVVQYRKDEQIIEDYREAQKEYYDITNKLLKALSDSNSSKTTIAKDVQSLSSKNIVLAEEHPQTTSSSSSSHPIFKVPEVPIRCSPVTQSKVMVQQNVVVHQLLEKANECKKSLVSNSQKRKSDSCISKVIGTKIHSLDHNTLPSLPFSPPNVDVFSSTSFQANAAPIGLEAFNWRSTSDAENSLDQQDFLGNDGENNFDFF